MREKIIENKVYDIGLKKVKAIKGTSCDECCLNMNNCILAPCCELENESFIFVEV